MTTINLREFFYWYIADEFVEVTEEVAEELRAGKRYEPTYRRRLVRNRAQYSLDAGDGIESAAAHFDPSPEALVLRSELCECLRRALDSLNEKQGRRVESNIILGQRMVTIARAEGVTSKAVSSSVRAGLRNMKKYLLKSYF